MTSIVRYSTAVHEAGHAIVAASYGLRVVRMWIDPGDRSGGARSSSPCHLEPVDQIAIHRAGRVAQNLTGCEPLPGASDCDMNQMFKVFMKYNVDDDARGPVRQEAGARAHAILDARRERLIEVATALAQAGELNEPRIVELLGR
jgi:hypothetical protein